MLDHLGPEESAAEHQEGNDQDHPGDIGPVAEPIRIEAVHASSRTENMLRNKIRTMSDRPAVVSACKGL